MSVRQRSEIGAACVALLLVACGQSTEGSHADASNGAGGVADGAAGSVATGGVAGAGKPDASLDSASDAGSGGLAGAAGSSLGGTGGTLVDGCTPNPPEVCNGVDDDCNGVVDDVDFTLPQSCGTCANDCSLMPGALNASCDPPAVLDGKTPGSCNYQCAPDFYDIVHDDTNPNTRGCEYYCPWNPSGTNTLDLGGPSGCNIDNDCDGLIDEDVDLCSVTDCGKCGYDCSSLPNAKGACGTTAAPGTPCSPQNTGCIIAQCDPGWIDADQSPYDGCETPAPDGG